MDVTYSRAYKPYAVRVIYLLTILLLAFSCKKSDNERPLKLLRREATTYTGTLLVAEYEYDSQNRITAIRQAEGTGATTLAVSISYYGNQITLISQPKYDPAYTINKEVRLLLDATGSLHKRTAYTVMTDISNPSSVRFKYDTLDCLNDVAGVVNATTRSYYDSSSSSHGINFVTRAISRDTFTSIAGSIGTIDRKMEYNTTRRVGSNTTIGGGSTENHTVFSYTKSYANKTVFTNAVVLNETLDYSGFSDYYGWTGYFESLLDERFQYMPEKTVTQTIERDSNGAVTFNYTSTYEMERTYGADGLLSAVNILSTGTPYTQIRYIYGR